MGSAGWTVEAEKDIIISYTYRVYISYPLHTMKPHQDSVTLYTVYLLLVLLTASSFTTPSVSAASASSKEEQTLRLLERLLERALEKRSCPGLPDSYAEWCLNTDPNKDPIDIFGNAITASSSFADTLCSNCD